MQENWNEKSMAELRAEAKERGIKGVSGLRKQELAERLSQGERPSRSENNSRKEREKDSFAPQTQYRNNGNSRTSNRRYNNDGNHRRYNNEGEGNSNNRRYNNEGEGNNNRRYSSEGEGSSNNRRYNNEGEGNNNYRRYNREDYEASPEPVREVPESQPQDTVFMEGWNTGARCGSSSMEEMLQLDSGNQAHGILELIPEGGYGFIRGANFMQGEDDIYVSPSQIRRFNLKTGDMIDGSIRVRTGQERFAALLYVTAVNGEEPSATAHRRNFEQMTPVFPNERIHLETEGGSRAMRIVDLMSPVGKGQRGMIVAPPKAGKTTLLKDMAKAIQTNHPEMQIIILLIDERPEEVTDIRESIQGPNVEVIFSTFDQIPDQHKRVAEMVLGRSKRLVEMGKDVVILMDSITRLARAYNLTVTSSGRTLSGGLDPAALHMPKKFFGAARNLREGGSLTILATALVDTGSRMDDVVFEEFKGTGNMELVLNRHLSERRIFPAIDMQKSGTRREDLLLTSEEKEAVDYVRHSLNSLRGEEATDRVLNWFAGTKNNREFVAKAKKNQ